MLTATDIHQLLEQGEHLTLECKRCENKLPNSLWELKPIFINGNPFTDSFRRNHEGDYRCTRRQVKAMVRDSYEDGNDGFLHTQCDMDDIDAETLRRYRTLFRYKNEGHVWNEVDDITFLKHLGGCVVDKGKVTLTMAGLMMFGTGLAVRERFSNFRMDYIDMCNLIGEERYSDRLTYDGRWENNLFQFFSIVLPKMTFDLPRPFRMEGVSRVDDTPQHKAVREAFTNSIIHADLMMESGVLRIEKHEDKLVFRNPGRAGAGCTHRTEIGKRHIYLRLDRYVQSVIRRRLRKEAGVTN